MLATATKYPGLSDPARYPSKWDIIPIHTSDRKTFKDCRRQWSFSSPATKNLVRKANVYGINENFWFGIGIHHALELYYKFGTDPVSTWIAWYEMQWNGGLVHISDLDEFADRMPKKHPEIEGAFIVSGLSDVLPDPDPVKFQEYKDLGIGMMTFYKDYAARMDNFDVVAVEHEFSVPIETPDGDVMREFDSRIMPDDWAPKTGSPIHHELIATVQPGDNIKWGYYKKPVHARGRIDLIVQDRETGQYGIMDHKTANRVDDDYFRHLTLDDQVTTYVWAAQREAELFDLPWKKIDFVIYQALRKCYPKPPTPLKNGKPSLNRAEESTTAALFEQYIKEHSLQIVYDGSDDMQRYYAYLLDQGDKVFIQRDVIHRNKFQVGALGQRLYYEARDMLSIVDDPNAHYPNPRKEYACLNCAFRSPCEAMEMGYDWNGMLQDGYVSNYDR